MKKFTNKIKTWWHESNEEGVRGADAVLIPVFAIGMFLIFANIFLYLDSHPEAVKLIGSILFPLAKN